jgi:hypothetical protein
MKQRLCLILSLGVFVAFQASCNNIQIKVAKAAEPASNPSSSSQSAESQPPRNPLRNAYFGDLHLHTRYSMDAFAFGTRGTSEDSFRYAMGKPVEYFGKQWKRLAPLAFLAVTDHARVPGRDS